MKSSPPDMALQWTRSAAQPGACTCMYNASMRTTIEISDKHRAALLEMAARRGEKGFSSFVGEALEAYLRDQRRAAAARRKALGLRGSLSGREAARLRHHATAVRASWR